MLRRPSGRTGYPSSRSSFGASSSMRPAEAAVSDEVNAGHDDKEKKLSARGRAWTSADRTELETEERRAEQRSDVRQVQTLCRASRGRRAVREEAQARICRNDISEEESSSRAKGLAGWTSLVVAKGNRGADEVVFFF